MGPFFLLSVACLIYNAWDMAKVNSWVKCISTEGHIRGVAIHATGLVQELAKMHQLKGVQAKGLGEAVMSALLLASYCKGEQKINLNIQGSGHFKQALVDAYPNGAVRGYVVPREIVELPEGTGPWGAGLLSVLRTSDEAGRAPYIGTVPLLTGHLAKDMSFYWVQSEQVPTAVGLAVHCENDNVVSARAFLIQALPGADSETLRTIERHVNEIQLLDDLNEKSSPVHVLSQIFQSTAFMIIEEKPLKFECNCSLEKVQRALLLLGADELRSIHREEKSTTLHCDFCTTDYQVGTAALEKLIAEL